MVTLGVNTGAGQDPEPSADDYRALSILTARLLGCDALRLKPNETQFCLMLSGDSFAAGRAWGPIGISFPVRGKAQTGKWCLWLSNWKTTEIWEMLEKWRRAVWLSVDVAEGCFRLAPERLPGWADALRLWQDGCKQSQLRLATENDLHKELSRLSQARAFLAAENAEFPHTSRNPHDQRAGAVRAENAEIPRTSPGGGVGGANVSETFNRLPRQRINVPNVNVGAPRECGIIAFSLQERVRKFVGEIDWQNPNFWNSGRGYQQRIFEFEAYILAGALDFVETGLRAGEIVVHKTKGALLWDEFQRARRGATKSASGDSNNKPK